MVDMLPFFKMLVSHCKRTTDHKGLTFVSREAKRYSVFVFDSMIFESNTCRRFFDVSFAKFCSMGYIKVMFVGSKG